MRRSVSTRHREPERGVAADRRCTTACTAPTTRIAIIQRSSAPLSCCCAIPRSTAAPASVGTATRATAQPSPARMPTPRIMQSVRCAPHRPRASAASRPCALARASSTSPLAGCDAAALASIDAADEAVSVPGHPRRRGYQRPPDGLRSGFAPRAPSASASAVVAEAACALFGLAQHVDDLVADELVALEQLVAQRDDEVPVARRAACCTSALAWSSSRSTARAARRRWRAPCRRSPARSDRPRPPRTTRASRPCRTSRPSAPRCVVACARSPPGPVPDSPKNSSSAVMPPNAIFIEPDQLRPGAR